MFNIDDSTSGEQQDVQDKPLKEWRSLFEAGTLLPQDIIKFFQSTAPNFFELHPESEQVRCSFNEPLAKVAIIDALEEFICGDNPQTLLDKLRSEGNLPSICGRVFKVGEPTYSCRECGMDPTCVLCVSCFKQSAHRFHKYKMSTSNGGGCCDCGEIEAWKRDQYCDEHIRGKDFKPETSLITNRMKERCEIAFRAILIYCVKFLEIESLASLECEDSERDDDVFCTVLYNDESHTFEQVIQTLTKIVKCPHKYAMEYVTSIDREGRAVVKCDTFENCHALKEAIEKQQLRRSSNVTKLLPLKVSVLHKRAVSCQQFALQLLTWFQEFLTRHITFRAIFATVANDTKSPQYNIGHILENDWKLWKIARSCWHRLLISGMLMEYENKKILAVEFSKHYSTINQDFIRDDHDHSISVVSLSVQLFTIPSIAHYLIANESIFYKLVHTFYWESIEKYVQNKTLHFAKNTTNLNVFKRAAFILCDLRYVLCARPDSWTPELREGFLEGVKALLKLLNVMQGMDAVYRQTGQHMDYEPEWESAFNLHLKLASVISSVLDWCSTDKEVLVKVYKMVIKYLSENEFIINQITLKEQKLSGHVAQCIMYDVASSNVSIHLPLSRFFAGLYLHLGKYGLNFDNATPMQKITPEEIMEPVLCTQTMIAQVHAGMWRRNGYSLLHQLFFYRNYRCRAEMLDRDIVALQIGAVLIESNQYMIHILNKFGLLNWASPTYEQTNNISTSDDEHLRILNMVDEFLELLIVILGERYMPGIGDVSEEDRIKKEIIQHLCIKNFSHSELNRIIPDNNQETVLEDVIDSVATFKKPLKSDGKGVYELKDEFHNDYNMYFYHYTKEEKSRSEEFQRNRRKAKGELFCCPPPKLPKLADGFVSIANLLQCDVMLSVMIIVLKRAADLKAKSFTESHLQKVLHLIGYGLQEEESGHYPFLTFYDRAVKVGILRILEKLVHSQRVEADRDFIIWVIRKFKELQPKEEVEMENDESNQPMTTAEAEKQEKEERARMAAERRAKIMAQMANAQKNFMKSNAELFASTSSVALSSDNMDWQELNVEDDAGESIACLGPKRKMPQYEEQKYKCILCFEDCVVSKEGPSLVYSAFIQKSKVLVGTSPDDEPAPHTGTCGHVMHASCWKEYFDNEILKENRRPTRNRSPNNFAAEKKEFLCPYCRCLSNAVIPLSPALIQFSNAQILDDQEASVPTFDVWVSIWEEYLERLYSNRQNDDFSEELRESKSKYPDINEIIESRMSVSDFSTIVRPVDTVELATSWKFFSSVFMQSIARVSIDRASEDAEPFLETWKSCAYTLQSMEMYLREINKPFKYEMSIRFKSCLSGLIRVCGLLGICIEENVADKLITHYQSMLEQVFRHRGKSVVEWDPFSMLISLIFMTSSLLYTSTHKYVIPYGSNLEHYFLQLMFLANTAKAVILYRTEDTGLMDIDALEEEQTTSGEKKDFYNEDIANFYRKFNIQVREKKNTNVEVTSTTVRHLIEYIKRENRIFLRCSSLLFHFLTDVEFPDQFCDPTGDTFEIMCKYLGLNPDIETYFANNGPFSQSMKLFACHPDLMQYDFVLNRKPDGKPLEIIPCVTPVRQLVQLPDDYSDLINSVSDFTCPNNDKEESRNPTMCLICGSILCAQSYCCQPDLDKSPVGACTYHAHFCCAGVGMFLRIRDCEIFFLGLNKGCYVSPPYLDEYGETDQGLRRGNPLRLCHERYRKLHLMWLGHGLHEEIARLNESTNSVIATQWQHM